MNSLFRIENNDHISTYRIEMNKKAICSATSLTHCPAGTSWSTKIFGQSRTIESVLHTIQKILLFGSKVTSILLNGAFSNGDCGSGQIPEIEQRGKKKKEEKFLEERKEQRD
ncbi:hypothetical protein CEXT_12441 [Caerostris extrusa]|uniref:Uncharacterized protein n=1 Tax=Caerostris extrusa TaxID=172846 RepID=A0AAV4UVK1_CAEEX|nr:hypothetical protein CEXT_12441 [Caerostris extrusa]